jgi:ubiquinol-cytochrome c reductase cytochrome b subunit
VYPSGHSLGRVLYNLITKYPSPGALNYAWNYGVLALIALGIQVITGVILAMFYTAHIDYAFYSVEHIMRDINMGYVLRYVHATGASFFFIVIYAHILRGLFFGSYHYPRSPLWYTGIIIFFVMIITAFLGYLLPWGQMSYWGGTVITNLVTILPYGESIVEFLWGGFSVGNPTLNKFYALHFIMPFILIVLVCSHLYFLHHAGSNNSLGIPGYLDKISFAPYYIWKDLYFAIIFFLAFFFVTFFFPNLLTDPDNYLEANALVTPPHIVPEWYFLPYYAILRGIPNKTFGVLALLSSIILIGLLPVLHKARIRILDFKILLYVLTVFFSLIFLLLFVLGSAPIAEPFITLANRSIQLFFGCFFILTVLEYAQNGFLKLLFFFEKQSVTPSNDGWFIVFIIGGFGTLGLLVKISCKLTGLCDWPD